MAAIKYLLHTMYREGETGLSNLVMSVEVAVVLAHLMDRTLVLRGNNTPSANVLRYSGFPADGARSTVTDLLDLPVPWIDESAVPLDGFAARDLTDKPLYESVFYYPPTLCTDSDDFCAFAGKRRDFLTYGEDLRDVPVIELNDGSERATLCYYSYFFYLEPEFRERARSILRRLQPKRPYAALAEKVARDLGAFNAVHVRRGDFKHTVGVTTLERKPGEVIEALDHHFDRQDPLVILTDEPEDPFFEKIVAAYENHLFLDQFILDRYRAELLELPRHDSIAIAFLAQLVAAESQDFIGTMTSTFSGLIQRYRGNRGRQEPFKFLWNELPDEGAPMEGGRHPVSNCVPLDRGVMVEEREGPYSWNRFNPRINPGWQREWPEAFLGSAGIADGAGDGDGRTGPAQPKRSRASTDDAGRLYIGFGGRRIAFGSDEAGVSQNVARLFLPMLSAGQGEIVAELRIEKRNGCRRLTANGLPIKEAPDAAPLFQKLKHEVTRRFVHAQTDLLWLHAGAVALDDTGIVLAGPWGCGKSTLVTELSRLGWSYLSDDVAPFDTAAGTVHPFPLTPHVRRPPGRMSSAEQLLAAPKTAVALREDGISRQPVPVKMLILPQYDPNVPAEMTACPLSPALAVLLDNCLSFSLHREEAVAAVCDLLERVPVYRLTYHDPGRAAQLVSDARP